MAHISAVLVLQCSADSKEGHLSTSDRGKVAHSMVARKQSERRSWEGSETLLGHTPSDLPLPIRLKLLTANQLYISITQSSSNSPVCECTKLGGHVDISHGISPLSPKSIMCVQLCKIHFVYL